MILAIAGQKGGTGKSTIAIAIAAELHRRGQNVLMIDGDPQATMRTWGDVAADAGLSTPTIVAMGSKINHDRLRRTLLRSGTYSLREARQG